VTAATARDGRSSTRGARPGWTGFLSSWRRSAEEVQSDQLVTAVVGVVSAVVGTSFALVGRGTAIAAWVGLVTLCVTPGCAFVCWQLTRDRLIRATAVLGASLTWTIVVSSLLVWLQVTNLHVVIAVTAGVGGIGSAVFLIYYLARYVGDPQDLVHADEWRNVQPWTSESFRPGQSFTAGHERDPVEGFAPGPERRVEEDVARGAARKSAPASGGRPHPVPRKHPVRRVLLMTALVTAVALYAISVTRARGQIVGSWGLLPVLGLPFLVAITVTAAILMIALRFIRTEWPIASAALVLLLIEFNGTQVIVDAVPLSSWAYKHFGVVDYMVHGGPLNDPLDIYQQWPGFFAAATELVRISGSSPLASGNWPHLLFEVADSLVVFAIARRLVPWHRAVPYITAALFVTANWEGQFYYSPQSMAFLLAMLFTLFLLPSLEPERLRWPFRKWRRLHIPPFETDDVGRSTAVSRAAQGIGLVGLFAAAVITHQMTPEMLLISLTGLWILGVLRQPFLMLTLVAITSGYLLLHFSAVDQNFVINGFSFANAAGEPAITNPSVQQAFAGHLSEVIGLGLWGAAAICILSYWRHLGEVAIPAVLAFAPFSLIMVSDYQGEGIYRVFLFSSPWCALIIARRLADLRRSPTLRLAIIGCWTAFAALGSAQSQDFGMYPVLVVPQSEISAGAYFLDHAPLNSALILGSANFPSRLNANYVLHNPKQSQNDLSLDEIPGYGGDELLKVNLRILAREVVRDGGTAGFLVIAPSEEACDEYYGFIDAGVMPALAIRLKGSTYWKLWYRNGATMIFQALPQGEPTQKSAAHKS
jgi:hypothetical protein